jgi:hypothetical protein
MKEILQKKYEKLFRRLHKSNGHLRFLTECSKKKITPNFTIISAQTVSQLNLNKSQITKHRLSQLQRKLDEQIEINQNLTFELNHTYTLLSTLIHHTDLKIIINFLISKVYKKEKSNDQRRDRKLSFLLKNFKSDDYAKISIVNFTKNNIKIPEKINSILINRG